MMPPFRPIRLLLPLALLLTVALSACDTTDASSEANATEEAVATSVAAAVAGDAGGVSDQAEDAVTLTTGGFDTGSAVGKTTQDDYDLTYDATTGTWTLSLDRQRQLRNGATAAFARTYQYQFLDDAGAPQRLYVTRGDTASTVTFSVVSASGSYDGPRLTYTLDTLTSDWTITNADTPVLTIDGSYQRSTSESLTLDDASYSLSGTLEATVALTTPRESESRPADTASGTLTGSYVGTLSGPDGDEVIDIPFSATIADGIITITVNGQTFTADATTGEMTG
jgi:hypothetical protein